MKFLKTILIPILLLTSFNTTALADKNPPIKKSKSGICHQKGGTYYDRTKNFIPYHSMEACIESGGRPAKR